MKTYMVGATEQIYEICYVKANSAEEAKKMAQDDWRMEWETIDGDFFEIVGVEELSEEEASSLGESVRTIDDYNKAVAAEEELEQNRS